MKYIIDNINPAPKWIPPPPKPTHFRTTLEKQNWWEKRKKLWREGYGDGYSHISGMHTFYLTEGTLKDGSDGNYIRPIYRDCDEWIIEPLDDAFWSLKNHIGLIKRREIGATSIGAGLLPAYTFRMFPNSTFGITSCDKDRIFKAFSDKTDPFIKEMDKDIRPVLDKGAGFKENATKNQIYWKLPFIVSDKNGQATYNYAELFAKETADTEDSAKGFSSSRMRAAYYDEFPLHRRKSKLLTSSQPCFEKSGEQSGMLFWGGTVEHGITPEQIIELRKLVETGSILNFKIIFAPAWWGYVMDKNGISNEEEGVAKILKKRDELNKLDDKTFLNAFIKNYPLTLDEIFELGGSDSFDEYARLNIKSQLRECQIRVEEPLPKKSSVIYINSTQTTETELNNKAPFTILEHPIPNVKYMLGVDGIMTSDLTSASEKNKLSKFATVVMKGIDPQNPLQFSPVAFYCERPKTIEDANYNTLNLLRYYNQYGGAKITGELNAGGEHLIKLIQNKGLGDTISYKKVLGNSSSKVPFFYRTIDMINWQYEAANIYFKKYSNMVWFAELLEDASKTKEDNTDILDAFMACLVGFGTGDMLEEKKEEKPKNARHLLQRWKSGRVEWYDPSNGLTINF